MRLYALPPQGLRELHVTMFGINDASTKPGRRNAQKWADAVKTIQAKYPPAKTLEEWEERSRFYRTKS